MIINADLLYDGYTLKRDRAVIIKGNRIEEVGRKSADAQISGIVTPAFIDAHSHIGMERQGEPLAESEVDDRYQAFTPLLNPVDSIYFDDRALQEAVDFGVLYSCVVPGSSNLLSGQAVVIRNFAANRHQAEVSRYGYKMALGFNPTACTEWNGRRHNTRMGNARFLEQKFSDVLRKEEQAGIQRERALLDVQGRKSGRRIAWIRREYELALSPEEWAVHELLSGRQTVKVHVHKEDDALYLIDLKKRFGLNVTLEHACDMGRVEIFNELADNGIPVVYGPLVSADAKTELKNASYRNVRALMASRAQFGLMTDHPVTIAHTLRDALKYFLIQGMAPETALGLITLKNAEILGLADRLGSIAPGKLASLVVWDRDPLHLAAFPILVMAEGVVLRDRR